MPTTDDPNDPRLTHGVDDEDVDQAGAYLVLSDEERAKGFVRPVRRGYIHMTCGVVTTMAQDIAETFAARPTFYGATYGATYCVGCHRHLPVGEFKWLDGTKVGS